MARVKDVPAGGVYQLKQVPYPSHATVTHRTPHQGQQRRVRVAVQPTVEGGTLPLVVDAVTSVAIGGITMRSDRQRGLDSYQVSTVCNLCE